MGIEVYKSQLKRKYVLVSHQMYGISKNQTTSDHPSSNVQSQSSISTIELGPNIIEASPKRKSMMASKYQKVWAWLNGPKKAPLGNHDKITNSASSRKWRWSCNSMKIYKSQLKWKYALVRHHMYGRSKKSENIGSSIIKCPIPIIYIHNWIRSKHHRGISQKKKHDGI